MIKHACRVVPLLAALVLSALPASAQEKDGPRFRGGVAAGAGGIFISGYGLGMGGIDGHLGVQINNMIGVYAQPYISFGGGKIQGNSAFTGTVGSNVIADFTFLDQIFVGVGGGGGIIGSVPLGQIHIRGGGYPVFTHGVNGVRRKGLMVALDMSIHIGSSSGVSYKLLQPMVMVGYEAF